ncbi:MAG: NUDIX hydrolase YfcD [Candidatus Binatia bacterium]
MAADELVDVVDADDNVIGQATRAEMRARRLRHRATYILVFNSQGQLFVHLRTADKDVYPSHYDVAVGGVVAAGESYDDGARRELAEELGVAGVDPRPILSFRYDADGHRVNGRIYSCTYDGAVTLQAAEIVSGEWLDLDQVVERSHQAPFCPDGIEALFRYLDRLASVQKS